MTQIKITQYLPPRGEKRRMVINVSDELQKKVDILHRNVRFEMETLTTGELSLSIERYIRRRHEWNTVVIRVGHYELIQEIIDVVEEMIESAYRILFYVNRLPINCTFCKHCEQEARGTGDYYARCAFGGGCGVASNAYGIGPFDDCPLIVSEKGKR